MHTRCIRCIFMCTATTHFFEPLPYLASHPNLVRWKFNNSKNRPGGIVRFNTVFADRGILVTRITSLRTRFPNFVQYKFRHRFKGLRGGAPSFQINDFPSSIRCPVSTRLNFLGIIVILSIKWINFYHFQLCFFLDCIFDN